MFRFAQPQYLNLLFLLIPIAGLMWLNYLWKMRRIRRFGSPGTVMRMVPDRSRYKYFVKTGLLLLTLALFLVSWARPQLGTKFEEVTREGVDLIVALDVSNSMKAEDIKPNRLESAKRELTQLIDILKGDRLGIILFAGDAYTQLPLTTDYSAALLLTEIIDADLVPKQGTAIGSAIDLARTSFAQDEGKYKAIIIITDGENHEDDVIAAAKNASADNIVVHAIGMGSPEGAPIPDRTGTRRTGYRRDKEGNVILTKLDENTLRRVAAEAGGKYVRASHGRNDLEAVFREIEGMEKREFGSKQFTDYEDRYQYFLALAILLLAVEAVLSEKRNRFISRFELFNNRKDQ